MQSPPANIQAPAPPAWVVNDNPYAEARAQAFGDAVATALALAQAQASGNAAAAAQAIAQAIAQVNGASLGDLLMDFGACRHVGLYYLSFPGAFLSLEAHTEAHWKEGLDHWKEGLDPVIETLLMGSLI